jgi:hypothetical protein
MLLEIDEYWSDIRPPRSLPESNDHDLKVEATDSGTELWFSLISENGIEVGGRCKVRLNRERTRITFPPIAGRYSVSTIHGFLTKTAQKEVLQVTLQPTITTGSDVTPSITIEHNWDLIYKDLLFVIMANREVLSEKGLQPYL